MSFRAKNMKRKFQFLRRQNTDTVVDHDNSLSIFTMTTYDQALLWSRSLVDLLRDKSKEKYIRNFCLRPVFVVAFLVHPGF